MLEEGLLQLEKQENMKKQDLLTPWKFTTTLLSRSMLRSFSPTVPFNPSTV